LDSDPVLIVPEFFRGNTEANCWIRDIRGQPAPHQVKSERELPKEVAATIEELGYGKKTIGLESGWLGHLWIPRPLNDIETFKKGLPNAKFADADMVIWGCRMIKSPLEIDRMGKAVRIIAEVHGRVVEEYRPGMTEMDIGKIIQHAEVERGDWTMGGGHIACGAVKEGMLDTPPFFEGVTINKGDYLWIDIQHPYKGYWADSARIFQVGPVTDGVKKKYELIHKALDAAAEVARPGVKAKDVYFAVWNTLKAGGVKQQFEMSGHGIGMHVHEPPSVGIWDETILQAGMTLNVEPVVLDGYRRMGGERAFHHEDLVVITDNGCYVIEGLRRDITQVSHPIA
ncbi:MAG: M24 family metallopeptidase, partial [Candidatus Bathyarchaeia archaeon]